MSAFSQLVLLSSFRPSSKYRQSIDSEEAAAFLHGYLALWHPAVASRSSAPPIIGSHYEFDQPPAATLFALPEVPNAYQPGDWMTRVNAAGALAFRSTASWETTLESLSAAIPQAKDPWKAADLQAFAGIGLGYLILEAFCDAQDHVNPLAAAEFYDLVRQAALSEQDEPRRFALGQAAHQLQAARETVYPSQFYQALTIVADESDTGFPAWLDAGFPFTVAAASSWLNGQLSDNQDLAENLRQRVTAGTLDFWGGPLYEQEDALLPLSALLANLRSGLQALYDRFGSFPESLGRRRFAATPTLPSIAFALGLQRALGFSHDGGVWPHAASSISAWRGPGGQLLESCNRKPEPVTEPASWFHLGNTLHESSLNEYVAWLHLGASTFSAEVPFLLLCWWRLHQLAPVFGAMDTLTRAIGDIPATEQFTPPGADDFQSEYLLDLTGQGHQERGKPDPNSRFARATRAWRDLESFATLQACWSAITPTDATGHAHQEALRQQSETLLTRWNAEDRFAPPESSAAQEIIRRLSDRLMARAPSSQAGYLIFNPCAFERNVAVRLPEAKTLLPAPALAAQRQDDALLAVVAVPPLGFAWVPCRVDKGTAVRVPRNTVVQGQTLQNEFLAVELDSQSGGIKSIRDAARQIPRVGQQLVHGPGSTMRCQEISVTQSGHALGELTSRGTLVDSHEEVLATFEQIVRVWTGRKFLELEIRLEPQQPLTGFPWHAFYGCRWAWRDPATNMYKSVHQTRLATHQSRPETPGFIELEMLEGRIAIFSGGLPFWQRHGTRMLDTLLVVPGESQRQFLLAVSLDDELPHQTAQDWLTASFVAPTSNGPPAAGVSSWLFHVDAPSILVRQLQVEPERPGCILAHLEETFGFATEARLYCPRNPTTAMLMNARGEEMRALRVTEDFVFLHLGCYELQWVRITF